MGQTMDSDFSYSRHVAFLPLLFPILRCEEQYFSQEVVITQSDLQMECLNLQTLQCQGNFQTKILSLHSLLKVHSLLATQKMPNKSEANYECFSSNLEWNKDCFHKCI